MLNFLRCQKEPVLGRRCTLCVWGTGQQMPLKTRTLLPSIRQVYCEIKMRAGCCMILDRERCSKESILLSLSRADQSLSDVTRDRDGKQAQKMIFLQRPSFHQREMDAYVCCTCLLLHSYSVVSLCISSLQQSSLKLSLHIDMPAWSCLRSTSPN